MERLTVGAPRISFSKGTHKPSCPYEEKKPCPPPVNKPCPPEKKSPEGLTLSPSAPLFTLFNKEIFGEDLLLLLLILILIEENADKLLIGALIYVFLG